MLLDKIQYVKLASYRLRRWTLGLREVKHPDFKVAFWPFVQTNMPCGSDVFLDYGMQVSNFKHELDL